MVTIFLYSVAMTHVWINNHSALVKICKYSVPIELRAKYNSNPIQRVVHYNNSCPKSISIEK